MRIIHEELKKLKGELAKGHTEGFLQLLRVLGSFPRYSLRNLLLIKKQKPEATLVAGIKQWNRLGRRVKRGEKGIQIFAPILQEVEVEEEGKKRREKRLAGFRPVYVWDVSQTEGQPLPEFPKDEGPEEVYTLLLGVCPFPVVERGFSLHQNGETDGKTIWVRKDLPPGQKAATLLHEWAHCILHAQSDLDPETKELEAEATAYAVGRVLGLEMKASRDYILNWRGTPEDLEASLERITSGAREILRRIRPQEGEEAEA